MSVDHWSGPNGCHEDCPACQSKATARVATPRDNDLAWMLDLLKAAAVRVTLANKEGDSILSAWLPDALAAIAKAEGQCHSQS